MATMIIFFAEVPEWQWHYDHALDSLYLMATPRFRLYVFFWWAFDVPLFSPLFDPTTTLLVVPLYMEHPEPIPLHQAPPPVAPTQSAHQASLESDPFEWMESSSSSSSAPDDDYAPADFGMANGFLSSESV